MKVAAGQTPKYYNATKAQENLCRKPVASSRNPIPGRRQGVDANTILKVSSPWRKAS